MLFTMLSGTYANGANKISEPDVGKAPFYYFPDAEMWEPSVLDNEYSKQENNPLNKPYVKQLEKEYIDYKSYFDPSYCGFSPTQSSAKGKDINVKIHDTQVKTIMGLEPLENWDKMVSDYLKNGGSDVIKEMNESMKGNKVIGYK